MTTPQATQKNGATSRVSTESPPRAAAPLVAPAPKKEIELSPFNRIRDLLERSTAKFAQVIPKHLSAERLVRVTLACIGKTPKLLECTETSLLNSVMQAAQLGLEPTGVLGSAYLVPYNNKIKDENGKERWVMECQLIPGYRGLIDLARRSGQIESIEAHVVHANDRFRCKYGLDPVLEHEPAWEGDPGPFKAVYAIAKLKDGGKQIEVMTKAQVEEIKSKSKASKFGSWVDHFDEMARKTVVRRIAKYLPLTTELSDALELDNEALDMAEAASAASAVGKGVEGLKSLVRANEATVDAAAEPEPPHDPRTGEVRDSAPSSEEQAEIAAREREESEGSRG